MAFPDLTSVNVYVASTATGTWSEVVGNISWDFDDTGSETRTRYMGEDGSGNPQELVTIGNRERSISIGGLYDPADTGQSLVRTTAASNGLIYWVLAHDDTGAAEAGRTGAARVTNYTDSVDVDGSDAARFTASFAVQGTPTSFTGGLPS